MRRFCFCAIGLLLLIVTMGMPARAAEPAPAARIIVLVRHGHYAPDPSADARLGPGLTPLGIAQAKLAAARLAGLPERFDQVWVSPLRRARETASVIASDLDAPAAVVAAALEECTPPSWREAELPDEPAEVRDACAKRLDQWFAERFQPAAGATRRELMVCHGNVIRYLITKALRVDSKAWLEMSVGHVSLTTIRIEADGRLKLIAAGDVGHVPPGLSTGASGDPERSLSLSGEG